MNRKIDPVKLTEEFNTLRMKNLKKIFNSESYYKLLSSIGISKVYAKKIAETASVQHRVKGFSIEYCFTETPLHKKDMIYFYADRGKHKKKEVVETPIEAAIRLLKSNGYRIFKDEGIREKELKERYPQIYNQLVIIKEI